MGTTSTFKINNVASAKACSGKAATAGTADTAKACSGNAATADKLKTSRTITLTGAVTGSAGFDGSGNVSITTAAGATE